MAVRITLSKGTCLLLGAGLGIAIACIAPSSVDADDKKKQKSNNNEFKNAATNTTKINEEKSSKVYGERTMSEILEKAKSEIRKVWDRGWRVVFLNSNNSSTVSSDVFADAQSSFPKPNDQTKKPFDPNHDSGDTDTLSTIYTPVGKLSISRHSTLRNRVKQGLKDVTRGYKRSSTSKNDSICKNFPRQSTLIESENKEEVTADENTGTSDKSNSNTENDNNRKLVLSFRTPFSPIVRIFQAVKRFKGVKKRAKERSNANAETHNSSAIQEAVV